MPAAGEDVKPSQEDKVNVFLRAQNHGELVYKVKSSAPFQKVINAFCKSKGLNPQTARFLSDRGVRLTGSQSIDELDLDIEEDENGEPTIYIDVMHEQTGGGAVVDV
ncbi:hypothetical protein FN846DRAFT_667270 [Sphaerosporella brunnea]|uniref:Rad60/SUMO-like domain-containing protein n=1 Tax=Sphaerosporella brunnea TaxID=1250544 RepID=A0A5J5EB33_9PEZI|nr:hypothetical protein FN846DRAFT_667270 [Sphaerosporella brunnea]